MHLNRSAFIATRLLVLGVCPLHELIDEVRVTTCSGGRTELIPEGREPKKLHRVFGQDHDSSPRGLEVARLIVVSDPTLQRPAPSSQIPRQGFHRFIA